eukprot:CAMPEP_0114612744 /NCGR_PEP_ID=MMETSP0168-20121206/4777_1 /TAXON_ID=95228 ORGANISM="Vannella sp., Strain DIVA3 517/6/12" /NCGR_SAMPLE_ID=MMETSP0168 /ASSEMBLY_ACC=CAM_ASM_000044 /LENGTH=193 /DNA_ID=CAMNT_0001823733 /DNA_START=32 /DNA_END=613 /DNA_ORIENTATION=+
MAADGHIEALVAEGKWEEVRDACELRELQAPDAVQPWAVHVLAHLILGDLPSARLVEKRAPPEARAEGTPLALAWAAGRHMWRREHADVHRATAALPPGPARDAAAALQLAYREHVFGLLSTAYSNIPLAQCARYLGISAEECRAYVAAKGWTASGEGEEELLTVHKQEQRKQQTVGLEQLRQLVEYSVFLES